MTNCEFAEINKEFSSACEKVKLIKLYKDLEPSVRQASKWRRQKGIVYKVANKVINLG